MSIIIKKFVYVDNAATTQISSSVFKAMEPYLKNKYGNPSSLYSIGRESKIMIETARESIAKTFKANDSEIFFTSSASESNNWAVKGLAERQSKSGKKHIITSNIEHHSILHTCRHLEEYGFEVTYLPVNDKGLVTAEQVKEAVRPDTFLVTIMYANNEIGTIQPIKEIGSVCKNNNIVFHTDAVQAVGSIEIDVNKLNIDLMSISGHKIYAPKGIGVLYVGNGTVLANLIDGGGQEKGKRAGTENIMGIVAIERAILDVTIDIPTKSKKITNMRDYFIEKVLTNIPDVILNGCRKSRLPGNINLLFKGVEGESLVLLLENEHIYASSGSACTSGSLDLSHVISALGVSKDDAHGSLRLSINENTTMDDIEYIIIKLSNIVRKLRAMYPDKS